MSSGLMASLGISCHLPTTRSFKQESLAGRILHPVHVIAKTDARQEPEEVVGEARHGLDLVLPEAFDTA